VATGIIRTIKQAMIERQLGEMSAADMQAIRDQIRHILRIGPVIPAHGPPT
jgi:mRNA-degrading endonuclease toxin of MazEF toxin-antitoxin module